MVTLKTFLRDVHDAGIRVGEHPDYGGVTLSLHMPGSEHATGNAGDLNYGPPGITEKEKRALRWAAELAEAAGLNAIYAYHRTHPNPTTNANHRDHLHVDDSPVYKRGLKPLHPGGDVALYRKLLEDRPAFLKDATPGYHWRTTTKRTHVYRGGPGKKRGRLLPVGYRFTVVDGSGVRRGRTWYVKTTSGNYVRSHKTRKD